MRSFFAAWILLLLGNLAGCVASQPVSQTVLTDASQQLRVLSLQAKAKTLPNGKSVTIGPDGDVLISNVPFAQQGRDNTCGQASMAMVLHYWAIDIDYLQIAREGNPLNIATSRGSIRNYLTEKGLQAEPMRGSLETLLNELHQARPVLLLLDYGGVERHHYVVVVGYNARTRKLILHDSNKQPYQEIDLEEFLMRWQNLPIVTLPLLGGEDYYRLMFSVRPKDPAGTE